MRIPWLVLISGLTFARSLVGQPPGEWPRFANPLVLILLVASGLSAVTGDVASFVIISSIVLLSVVPELRLTLK